MDTRVGGAEIVEDPKLREGDRPRWVAVEALDLAVDELEHVGTRRIHAVAGGRDRSPGHLERAAVCSLQGQLNYDNVAGRIEVIELSVHVRERRPVVDDRVTDVDTAVCDTDGLVRERPVVSEAAYEGFDVLFLGGLVGLSNVLLVFEGHFGLLLDWIVRLFG
jgi:hypothetical protein